MPGLLEPTRPEELRDALGASATSKCSIELFGGNSKKLMAGPVAPAEVRISTARMRRIIQYEPRDLTVSVEAGVPFTELNNQLARNGLMIPLDGACNSDATVGGVVAANINGARRRRYGAARDLVIGMTFATLEGKLVQSGGMVVKNVAGLDLSKLMIGSFGTLAAIASVNFKLMPRLEVTRTLIFSFEDMRTAVEASSAASRSILNPAAVELLNPVLSAQLNFKGHTVAVLLGGSPAVIERSAREVEILGASRTLSAEDEQRFWATLQQLTPRFLEKFREGAVVRISAPLSECGEALGSIDAPGHAHAASGIVRGWFSRPEAAARCLAAAKKRNWNAVVEFATEPARRNLTLWPEPGPDFAIMKQIKRMFDPEGLLNRGRLYGQI